MLILSAANAIRLSGSQNCSALEVARDSWCRRRDSEDIFIDNAMSSNF